MSRPAAYHQREGSRSHTLGEKCVCQVRVSHYKKRKKFWISFSRFWSFCKAVINTYTFHKDPPEGYLSIRYQVPTSTSLYPGGIQKGKAQTNIASLRWLCYILLAHWILHLCARPTSSIKCSPMFTVNMRSAVHKQICYKLLNRFMAGKFAASLSSILHHYWNSLRHFLTVL